MATEEPTAGGFGEVSRLRGLVFEYLSFGASVFGILALAVLLIYVFIDAFALTNGSPEWLLTYFLTLVVPFLGFCLYAADDPTVTRRSVVTLAGGLVVTAVVFEGIELLIRPVPRLNWQLVYLFVVVLPVTAYVVFAASREPTGAAGLGVIGRLYGGTIIGVALGILFLIFDPRLWFLVYTAGLVPATLVYTYGRYRGASGLRRLAAVVALAGVFAGVLLRNVVRTYPTRPLIFLWTLAVPIALAAAGLVAARGGSRRSIAAVGVVPIAAAAAGIPVGEVGLPAGSAVVVFVAAAAPVSAYTHRIVATSEGNAALGLGLPLLLGAGVLAGATVVGTLGFAGPTPWIDLGFLTNAPSRTPEDAGLYPAIVGSVIIIAMVAVLSFVLAVGTAVFLEEYASDTGVVGAVTRVVQVNITNLAAVPSVVYGLLGLGLFARLVQVDLGALLPGRSSGPALELFGFGLGTAVTASLTLSLLILPITVVSAQEAIRSVPDELRRGSDAMGATRWQTTKNVVLPEALPGIFTGVILSLGRAIGETAPLIMIGAASTVFNAPDSVWSKFTAMPMQIFVWSDLPQDGFRYGAVAAGVVTLLIVLLSMNATAIILRNRSESEL